MAEVGTILVERSSWPEDGRIGRIAAGEYAGAYLLLAAEINDSWAFYISDDPRVPRNGTPVTDDFWALEEDTPRLLAEMEVEWADDAHDADLEKEIFDIRSEWHRIRSRRAKSPGVIRSLFGGRKAD
ncbi:hypothetical protein [Streptomyces sp. NBC_01443]|uniref:hypothetical protein n=1 Tax=Streptomyces sp. NBC_01443 TaxID=2903868 RepID=UPI00224E908E|nr:hypothetical protein [Streptomyces sp. NBC_01443]MCX4632655.1 hypothetical protein [Streptomyces sp. NBC_01443]